MSLRHKLIFIIILLVCIPLIFTGIYFYSNISYIFAQNTYNSIKQLIYQVNNNIDTNFYNIDNMTKLFMSNADVVKNLEAEPPENEKYKIQQNIESDFKPLIFSYAWENKMLKSIFLFKNKDTYFYILHEKLIPEIITTNTDIFESSLNMKEEMKIVPPTSSERIIYYIRNIHNLNYPINPKGKLILGVYEEALSKPFESILQYQGSQAIIFDNSGTIFSHSDKTMLGKKVEKTFFNMRNSTALNEVVIGREEFLMASKKIGYFDLYSIISVPKSQVLTNLSKSVKFYLNVIFIIVAVSFIFSIFFSSIITKPIKDLMKNINLVKNGDFNAKMPSYRDWELNQLSVVFNKMTDEINFLINQVYEKQLLLKESELGALKSQVNPHFIFNVLGTISWEAQKSGSEKIYKMATSLGQLLRAHMVEDSKEKITIREELEYIEFYLYLQKMRFGDKLHIHKSKIDDALMDYCLPRLCIQPIVENSIVHGLENKRDEGSLTINIYEKSGIVYFEIIDDGVGFDLKDIELDNTNRILMSKQGHTRIGLYNSNKRIKLLYGEQYGIFIESKVNHGTRVVASIPLDRGNS